MLFQRFSIISVELTVSSFIMGVKERRVVDHWTLAWWLSQVVMLHYILYESLFLFLFLHNFCVAETSVLFTWRHRLLKNLHETNSSYLGHQWIAIGWSMFEVLIYSTKNSSNIWGYSLQTSLTSKVCKLLFHLETIWCYPTVIKIIFSRNLKR